MKALDKLQSRSSQLFPRAGGQVDLSEFFFLVTWFLGICFIVFWTLRYKSLKFQDCTIDDELIRDIQNWIKLDKHFLLELNDGFFAMQNSRTVSLTGCKR